MYKKILNMILISNLFLSPVYAKEDYEILINKSEKMAYVIQNNHVIKEFSVGIGKKNYETPLGEFKIINKVKNPSWYPSYNSRWLNKNIKECIKKKGSISPESGLNPLKDYWIGLLSTRGIGIHDIDGGEGIGERCSHGCIRAKTKNLEFIFNEIPLGTKVKIIEEE